MQQRVVLVKLNGKEDVWPALKKFFAKGHPETAAHQTIVVCYSLKYTELEALKQPITTFHAVVSLTYPASA